MKLRIFAMGLVCAAALCGQKRFNWQNYCFDHPAAPFCPGHEYAIKRPRQKNGGSPAGAAEPGGPQAGAKTASLVEGGIDWRFADPEADVLVECRCSGLAGSPFTRNMIAQLASAQGLGAEDLRKIFDRLAGVERIAVSFRDHKVVAMITGGVVNPALPPMEGGLKAAVSGKAMLVGHAAAVDEAIKRLLTQSQEAGLAGLAAERPLDDELWAIGSGAALGSELAGSGLKRFSMEFALRSRFVSDVTLEFESAPGAEALRVWKTAYGTPMAEGTMAEVRSTMEAEEAKQKFGQIASTPPGRLLESLVQALRYIPAVDGGGPKTTKVVIYGLDGGPKDVAMPGR